MNDLKNLMFIIFLNVTCEKYEINLCEQNCKQDAKNPKIKSLYLSMAKIILLLYPQV